LFNDVGNKKRGWSELATLRPTIISSITRNLNKKAVSSFKTACKNSHINKKRIEHLTQKKMRGFRIAKTLSG
jgi:predicted XRE-type DNA-binding protein